MRWRYLILCLNDELSPADAVVAFYLGQAYAKSRSGLDAMMIPLEYPNPMMSNASPSGVPGSTAGSWS